MPRRKRQLEQPSLPTIWRVPDDLWKEIELILAQHDPAKPIGRKRIDPRRALDGIIYRLRSGVQWNQLPREFGDDASVHRTFQRWVGLKVFDQIWAVLQSSCDELGAVDWEWQSADGAMSKARFGGTLSDQTRPIEVSQA